MEEKGIYFLVMAGLLIVQLLLCFKVKQKLIKLTPLILVMLLMLLCVCGYALSGWMNWAFLIVILILLVPLGIIGTAWLIYGFAKAAMF